MRELLYSYGSSNLDNLDKGRDLLGELVRSNVTTKFPAADPLPEAGVRTRFDLNYYATRDRNDQGSARDVPVGWRAQTFLATTQDAEYHIEDREFNLGWRIPNVSSDSFRRDSSIYRLSVMQAFRQSEGSRHRRPSLPEFISLLGLSHLIRPEQIIDEHQFYWLGDGLETGERLLVSLKNRLPDGAGRLVLSSIRISGQSSRLNVYSIDPRRDMRIVGLIQALDITVCRLSDAEFAAKERSLQ